MLSELGDAYQTLLEAHAAILRSAIGGNDGIEVNTEGDAFFAVFAKPGDALAAATAAQTGLAAAQWPDGRAVRVRMGVHSGEGRLGGDDYVGMDVNRAARIASAAHGGQVLVSDATRSLIGAGPDGFALARTGSAQPEGSRCTRAALAVACPGPARRVPSPACAAHRQRAGATHRIHRAGGRCRSGHVASPRHPPRHRHRPGRLRQDATQPYWVSWRP